MHKGRTTNTKGKFPLKGVIRVLVNPALSTSFPVSLII